MAGTARYMSPEQVRGETLDTRTDLFSFGLVLYEMSTGQQAFTGDTAAELRDAILSRTPVWAPKLVTADLRAIISKSIEKDRDRRYQTAAELRAELIRLRQKTSATPNKTSRRWLATGAAALLAVMAAVFWFPVRRPAGHSELGIPQLCEAR